MPRAPLIVSWISDFPIEWLAELPPELSHLPREHPATWQLVLLGEFQKRTDLELHIVLLRKNIARDIIFASQGATFHVLKVPRASRALSLFWMDTMLIGRTLRKIKPHLVHAWGTERGAGLIASRLGYPYLITIQGLLTWYKQLVPLQRYERFAALLEKVSLRRCKLATTESAFAVRFLQTGYPHLLVRQAEHAPNWLFHAVQRIPQTSPLRFITVGTLGFRKGSDLLLKAFSALADEFPFELIIAGTVSGAYLDSHKALLSDELRRRVTFKKDLSPAQVAAEMAKATIMVLPTRADTSPNAVKEAVVSGVPVVASAIGGVVDYVFPDQNGVLFPANDLQQFTDAIRKAMDHAQLGCGKVDYATLSRMRDYLSPEEMNRRFFAAYQETLALYETP